MSWTARWTWAGLVAAMAALAGWALWGMNVFRTRWHGLWVNQRWEAHLEERGIFAGRSAVFFGDSQMALWRMAPSFGLLPIRNRGISGDRAVAAVQRFERDVLAWNPAVAAILIGTNDLAGGERPEAIAAAIDRTLEAAAARGVSVLLCGVLPVRGSYEANRSPAALRDLNGRLEALAEGRAGVRYIDFWPALAGEDGRMRAELTDDGLHPNERGYAAMAKTMAGPLALLLYGEGSAVVGD